MNKKMWKKITSRQIYNLPVIVSSGLRLSHGWISICFLSYIQNKSFAILKTYLTGLKINFFAQQLTFLLINFFAFLLVTNGKNLVARS